VVAVPSRSRARLLDGACVVNVAIEVDAAYSLGRLPQGSCVVDGRACHLPTCDLRTSRTEPAEPRSGIHASFLEPSVDAWRWRRALATFPGTQGPLIRRAHIDHAAVEPFQGHLCRLTECDGGQPLVVSERWRCGRKVQIRSAVSVIEQ